MIRLKTILLAVFVCLALGATAQDVPDYVVLLKGDTLFGKVGYAPGDVVNFKDRNKKWAAYKPLQIKGYQHKGVFYISKIIGGVKMFMPHFRKGDDPDLFKKRTKLEVLETGYINVYYYNEYTGAGTNFSSQEALYFDVQRNIVLIRSGVGANNIKETLLNEIEELKQHQELYNRIATNDQKIKTEQVALLIKEFNLWYQQQHLSN